jgi:hypothetical protein
VSLGATLEAEIREQPAVWERLAAAERFARHRRRAALGRVRLEDPAGRQTADPASRSLPLGSSATAAPPCSIRAAGLGPSVGEAFNTLAWLVTRQMLALVACRSRGIDGDRPRGLTKVVI